jgi:hypothetical protein
MRPAISLYDSFETEFDASWNIPDGQGLKKRRHAAVGFVRSPIGRKAGMPSIKRRQCVRYLAVSSYGPRQEQPF